MTERATTRTAVTLNFFGSTVLMMHNCCIMR